MVSWAGISAGGFFRVRRCSCPRTRGTHCRAAPGVEGPGPGRRAGPGRVRGLPGRRAGRPPVRPADDGDAAAVLLLPGTPLGGDRGGHVGTTRRPVICGDLHPDHSTAPRSSAATPPRSSGCCRSRCGPAPRRAWSTCRGRRRRDEAEGERVDGREPSPRGSSQARRSRSWKPSSTPTWRVVAQIIDAGRTARPRAAPAPARSTPAGREEGARKSPNRARQTLERRKATARGRARAGPARSPATLAARLEQKEAAVREARAAAIARLAAEGGRLPARQAPQREEAPAARTPAPRCAAPAPPPPRPAPSRRARRPRPRPRRLNTAGQPDHAAEERRL